MTLPTDYPPIPGMWVTRAQVALDSLSTMTTPAEVAACNGSARCLTEVVLGSPVAGGAATRRAIRATGGLLTHRLGPALAAEALSWAASIAEAVSTSTVEAFLEAAAEAVVVHRPLRIDDRHRLLEHLRPCRTEADRRATIRRLWRTTAPEVESWPSHPEDDSWLDVAFEWNGDAEPEIEAWLQSIGIGTEAPAEPEPKPRVVDVYTAASEAEQIAAFDRLDGAQRSDIAQYHGLFQLAEGIVGRCLVDMTPTVLSNPACPQELRERIRHPYDRATLELAVRAGRRWFALGRVRRMLRDLDGATHQRFLTELPLQYVAARQACGLNTLHELLQGCLAGLDLTDRGTAQAVLGTAADWHWRRVPTEVVEVLIHHPQARHLTWTLAGPAGGQLTPELAHRGAREACPQIAGLALRSLPVGELTAEHAALALATGAYWVARCPGIPASARPARSLPWPYERWDVLDWERHEGASRRRRRATEPFVYPPVIEALQSPYPEAPGWKVTLPDSPEALARNAELMRNCTASYADRIDAGRVYVIVVESPEGTRYNAAVHAHIDPHALTRYRVGEINSRANSGEPPAWLRGAIATRLASFRPVEIPEPEPPARRPTGRRERRQARARRDRRGW